MKKINAVLFDLDGTLIDTASDLNSALNTLLTLRNIPTIPLEQTRSLSGRGSRGLLKVGMKIDDTHADFEALSAEFFEYYQKHLVERSALFAGMTDVLSYFAANHIAWGIVTNKPQRFTTALVNHFPLLHSAQSVVSGDTLKTRKPHPETILHACQQLNQPPENCLYVGDAEIDMVASRAAGTQSLVALYGYIHPDEQPMSWDADGFIEHPLDIINWLTNTNGASA
jgi:2-phosphoglycolate phosphatase